MSAAFFVVDIETTGLDIGSEYLIEVGAIALDENLGEVARHQEVVSSPGAVARLLHFKRTDPQHPVLQMHQRSGLAAELFDAHTEDDESYRSCEYLQRRAAQRLRRFFESHSGLRPAHLVGSSVHFDAAFLQKLVPDVLSGLHHRRVDVSSIKVVADCFAPEVARARHESTSPVRAHRAIPDCLDTIEELKFYIGELAGARA